MKILLDTHILLWTLSNDIHLSDKARKLIVDMENEIYYSLISLWEIEIQHLIHPDAMPVSAEEVAAYCEQSGFRKISIKEKHIFAMAGLKRRKGAPPHKDPFDRMLICQGSTENMLFITHDSLIPDYHEPCILSVQTGFQTRYDTNGLYCFSKAIVVSSPWPGYTFVSSGSGNSFSFTERTSSDMLPPGKSLRPTEP